MPKPSTPDVWASNKTFSFTPNPQQIAQGFDYIATIGRPEGAPITDDHDWPLNQVTQSLKWIMDQLPDGGIQALLSALLPKRSFNANDYIRIPDVPGGFIIQWGITTSGEQGRAQWAYPVAFPKSRLATLGMFKRTYTSDLETPTMTLDNVNDPSPLSYSNFILRQNGYGIAGFEAFVFIIGY
ncbi:MAG: gp53-like domain-containing protein [Plesiomonas sp.]